MENSFSILIIEDDVLLNDMTKRLLTQHGYCVTSAYSGSEALLLIEKSSFDLILLDLMLPGIPGEIVLDKINAMMDIPIIGVSAKTDIDSKVNLIRNGADDYITKPFGTPELMARIRASLRHSNRMDSNAALYIRPYKCKELFLDFDKRVIMLGGEEIHLTQVEYKIVAFLARNSGKVMTYSAIMSNVWGPYANDNNRILRVNMANIRRKLKENPSDPRRATLLSRNLYSPRSASDTGCVKMRTSCSLSC